MSLWCPYARLVEGPLVPHAPLAPLTPLVPRAPLPPLVPLSQLAPLDLSVRKRSVKEAHQPLTTSLPLGHGHGHGHGDSHGVLSPSPSPETAFYGGRSWSGSEGATLVSPTERPVATWTLPREEQSIGDPEFAAYRATMLATMRARNGGSQCISNPRMRRSMHRTAPPDQDYMERRAKNNAAAKRSRDLRKLREDELAIRVSYLEGCNTTLKARLDAALAELARMQRLH